MTQPSNTRQARLGHDEHRVHEAQSARVPQVCVAIVCVCRLSLRVCILIPSRPSSPIADIVVCGFFFLARTVGVTVEPGLNEIQKLPREVSPLSRQSLVVADSGR